MPVMEQTPRQALHPPMLNHPNIDTTKRPRGKERDTGEIIYTETKVQTASSYGGVDTVNGISAETEIQAARPDGRSDTGDSRETEIEVHRETEVQESAPDGGWGWFVMIGTLLTFIIVLGLGRSSGVFYLKFKIYYGASALVTSWVVSISYMLIFLLGPLTSALCNRFTVRTVVTLGATLSTLGMFLSAISPNIYFLYFSFGILLGFGNAFAYSPSVIILGQYFIKRRSLTAGIATSGAPFSACVYPFILEVLWSHYGFFGTFLLLTAVYSHLYISAAIFRPLQLKPPMFDKERLVNKIQATATDVHDINGTQHDKQLENKKSCPTSVRDHQSRCRHYQSFFKEIHLLIHKRIFEHNRKQGNKSGVLLDVSLLKNFAFLCLCIQQFLFSGIITNMFIYLPALAIEKGIKQTSATYLLSVMGVADGFSRIFLSMFLDLERVRPYRLIIYNLNIFVAAFMSLVLPFLANFWQFCVVSGLTGATFGIYISQMSVACIDVLGVENLTSSFGLLSAFEGIGSLVSPTIGGLVRDYYGSYDVAFYISTVGTMSAGATLAAGNWWLYQRRKNGYDAF